jgi:hypothetical protein
MENKKVCGIIYPKDEISDVTGCININCNGEYICFDEDGIKWHWKEDYECTCGCWDEWEETNGMIKPCLLYWKN